MYSSRVSLQSPVIYSLLSEDFLKQLTALAFLGKKHYLQPESETDTVYTYDICAEYPALLNGPIYNLRIYIHFNFLIA